MTPQEMRTAVEAIKPMSPEEVMEKLKETVFIDEKGEQPAIIGKRMEDWFQESIVSVLLWAAEEVGKVEQHAGNCAEPDYCHCIGDCTSTLKSLAEKICENS